MDANANERKSAFMKSDLDKEITPAPGVKDQDYGHRVAQPNARCHKQQEMETTQLAAQGFYQGAKACDRRPDAREVVTLKLNNLPKEANDEALKRIAGTKHVISAATSINNIKNECTGTGEVSLRLGEGETKDQVLQRFADLGIDAQDPSTKRGLHNNYRDLADVHCMDAQVEVQTKTHINNHFSDNPTIANKVRNLSSNLQIGDNDNLTKYAREFEASVQNGVGHGLKGD